MVITALETMYAGHIYRSRLEARWAVFFDTLKIRFWYEPQGYKLPDGTCYLPDFFLPQIKMHAEVKPAELSEREMYKCRAVAAGTFLELLMLVGPPDFKTYDGLIPCILGQEPEQVVDAQVSDFLLDIDYHGRKYFLKEHRLYGCTGGGFEKEEDFTPEYREAVYASRAARFEERRNG